MRGKAAILWSGPKAGLPVRLAVIAAAALFVSCGQQPRAGDGAAAPTPPQSAAASASPIPWKTIEPPAHVAHPAGTPNVQAPPRLFTFSGTGVVRAVHLEEGWLEIDHEEIKGIMPAMQMEWSVRRRSMLKSIRAGDKVNFSVEDNHGSQIITELKKAPPAR